jgi:integrase
MQSGLKILPAKSRKLPPIIFRMLTVLSRHTRPILACRPRYDLLHMRHTNFNKGARSVQSKDGFANDQAKSIDALRLAIRELERWLTLIDRKDNRPTSTITFAQFAGKWKAEIMVHHKPSSRSSEKSIIRVQLVPFFGRYELGDINLEMIQKFVNTSEKSPKTVKNAISTLMVMWDMARAWGYAQHNPFPRGTNGRLLLKLPAAAPSETYHFTVEEALAIIDKAQGRWKTFFRILAETGMRPGELAGLRVEDVGTQTLRVAQSVWQQQVQTPKTKAGVRTFAISSALGEEVRKLSASSSPAMTTTRDSSRLLFTTEAGNPLSMDNFRQRVLNPILAELGIDKKLERMGITRCGNYAFRHMNATLMDTLNTPMKTRQKRLGHADVTTTLTHYSHPQDADDMAVADALGALLSPKRTRPAESP